MAFNSNRPCSNLRKETQDLISGLVYPWLELSLSTDEDEYEDMPGPLIQFMRQMVTDKRHLVETVSTLIGNPTLFPLPPEVLLLVPVLLSPSRIHLVSLGRKNISTHILLCEHVSIYNMFANVSIFLSPKDLRCP